MASTTGRSLAILEAWERRKSLGDIGLTEPVEDLPGWLVDGLVVCNEEQAKLEAAISQAQARVNNG